MSKHLEVELESLKAKLLSLTLLVEEAVKKAVTSISEQNKALAVQIIKGDVAIDEREVRLEEECLKILALHQPVASDLRFIVGVLKINNDLERIGDLAVNIAERALFLSKSSPIKAPIDLKEMGDQTYSMLKRCIDALIQSDINLARQVIQDDQIVDDMNREMYEKIFSSIKNAPDKVAENLQYLSASRHLERIADFTTNISEDVIYMVDGAIIRHQPEMD